MKPLAQIVVVGLALAGCVKMHPCKQSTILVAFSLASGAADADTFDISAAIDGATLRTSIVRKDKGQSGTVELDFAQQYPVGKSVTLTFVALRQGLEIGRGSVGPLLLPATCTSLMLPVADESKLIDMASSDLALDANLPPSPLDMTSTMPLDMTKPLDLMRPDDMSLPCVNGTIRCNPTDHNYQQQCTNNQWVNQQCLVKSAPPVNACTEAKNTCVDTGWVQWSYKSIPANRFSTIADSSGRGETIINDSWTGLYWQLVLPDTTYTYAQAGVYCDGLSYGGFSDWRLPSPTELTMIVDFAASTAPVAQSVFLGNIKSAIYWTSASKFGDGTSAWTLDFSTGTPFVRPLLDPATNSSAVYRVRCVR